MTLFLLSIILGFALRRTWTAILRQRRAIARLNHMQAEIGRSSTN